MSAARVRDLLERLDGEFPFAWAEGWDRVGLLVGDPESLVERVFVSLDPTPSALAGAIEVGAQVLLTHHPAFLDPPERFMPAAGMAGVPFAAASAGVALIACHTNLDRAPAGADALPAALGLRVRGPLESSTERVAAIVTYVPAAAVDDVLAALHGAGAGRIGRYADCAFMGVGEGRYTPLDGSSPAVGRPGVAHTAAEVRLEVFCDPSMVDGALRALRGAHPYEEPVAWTSEAMRSRGVARMGRLCEPPAEATLSGLAEQVSRALGVKARVWGDASTRVSLVGVAPGSGRSLVADARRAGCDALITGELRYHEALDAVDAGLSVIEAGHDATEWPLVPVLAACAAGTEGLGGTAVVTARPSIRWWTTEGV